MPKNSPTARRSAEDEERDKWITVFLCDQSPRNAHLPMLRRRDMRERKRAWAIAALELEKPPWKEKDDNDIQGSGIACARILLKDMAGPAAIRWARSRARSGEAGE